MLFFIPNFFQYVINVSSVRILDSAFYFSADGFLVSVWKGVISHNTSTGIKNSFRGFYGPSSSNSTCSSRSLLVGFVSFLLLHLIIVKFCSELMLLLMCPNKYKCTLNNITYGVIDSLKILFIVYCIGRFKKLGQHFAIVPYCLE